MLHISSARRALGDHVLFNNLSLDLDAGRFGVVVGPNGVGKSTLLRCIAGDGPLDAGTITVDGLRPDDADPAFRAAVAAELGDDAVFTDLSVGEHLRLLTAAHRMSPPRTDDRIADVLADAGLGDLADRFPHTLSTGQRQRFALVAAFWRPAQLVIFDEPERGLDAAGQDWVASCIARATDRGAAVLAATHSPMLAEAADVVVDLSLQAGDAR
ncbi:putative ABC transporter ATP-binding protein [Gordonia effusa NBRC 100432]|uniref:Putative ABC transporter ATP-binding protein n=1 Tax=Gordonia effusa NBRC 100432 TaxID=1077974 RepID=H0QZ27_9ACTN|nr:ATP-binding cassette domain-containing protein [Gordonia effusa]GAB18078.1 putative ABC transporter ATP-binding protein [Gordonia effusa NBRC 100432]